MSPEATAFEDDSAADHRKFPADDASHTLICEIVSVPVMLHDGFVPVMAIDPPEAAANVTWERVVTTEGLVAPAEPGSPMCSFTHSEAGWANAEPPRIWSSSRFARLLVLRPTAMGLTFFHRIVSADNLRVSPHPQREGNNLLVLH